MIANFVPFWNLTDASETILIRNQISQIIDFDRSDEKTYFRLITFSTDSSIQYHVWQLQCGVVITRSSHRSADGIIVISLIAL